MTPLIESTVPEGTPVMRIDRYLAGRFTYFSRTRWQKEIARGLLAVNGRKIHTHIRVRPGDIIAFQGKGQEEPEVDGFFEILYEDDDILAVNKSGDLPVHPAGPYFNNST